MDCKIEFNMDNAAFSDFHSGEVKRILDNVNTRLKRSNSGRIFDVNGNCIGSFKVE